MVFFNPFLMLLRWTFVNGPFVLLLTELFLWGVLWQIGKKCQSDVIRSYASSWFYDSNN